MKARLRADLGCVLLIAGLLGGAGPARAQSLADLAGRLEGLQQELQTQRSLIADQARRIEEQRAEIDLLRSQVVAAAGLTEQRAAGLAQGASVPAGGASPSTPLPDAPVGEAPTLARVEEQVQAVPEGAGVLTRPGRIVLEPSIEYTAATNNRLVFRGVELIPALQAGLITASDVDRSTLVATGAVRYGLTRNIELEARVPFLIRSDQILVLQQRDDQIVEKLNLEEKHIGDIEFAVRYQLNRPVGQRPIFVGSLRVKTDTGKSPYEIPFDEFNIATGLATGSGFWAVQPGLNFLLPTDPAVIFGGVSYLWHIPRTFNRAVGNTVLGRVDPGDAIGGNIGFGFALNPRFSFSLGYRHSYIFPTESEIGGTIQRSNRLQVGSLSLGMSYRLNDRQSLNLGVDVGATSGAPDVSVNLRMPFSQ